MSQSPPSYSPIRRQKTQDSQLSGSESEADEPVTQQPQDTAQESPERAPSPQQETALAGEAALDDEEMSEDADAEPAHPAGGDSPAPASFPPVAQNADESASGSEAEGDVAMGGALPARESLGSEVSEADAPVGVAAPARDSLGSEFSEAPAPVEQNADASEDEEVEDAAPPAVKGPEDESEEEVQPEDPVQPETQADAEGEDSPKQKQRRVSQPSPDEMAVDAASPGVSEALVPVDTAADAEADTANPVVVAGPRSPSRESWGALPKEAEKPWTVDGEECSLEVGGNVLRLPKTVYARLFAYQRQGVAWLWNLFQKGMGGILADEMGLGKTVQVAAFLASLKISNEGSRFLVIVPPTLLEQWKRELKSWSAEAGLPVHVMHGTMQERRAALRGMLARPGVMVTTYDLTRNCVEHLRVASLSTASALLPKKRKKQVKRGCRDDDSPSENEEEPLPQQEGGDDPNRPWDVVIVDEGHQIKNPACMNGRALRKLEAKSRFLLTGTPLQNKLSDLWALMDFAQPGLLGNHATFDRNFSEQIAKGSKRNATKFAVELKDHLARELRRLTAPHFLRRLKDEVLTSDAPGDAPAPSELPSKTDVVLWLNLTNAQVELYNLYLQGETVRRATSGKNGMEALRAISMLKKLSNHPLLCMPKEEFAEWRMRTVPSSNGKAPDPAASSNKPPAPEAQALSLDTAYDDDAATQPALESHDFLARLRALLPNSAEGAALLSCKLRVLSVLLPQLHKRGHRCLIFSQSTRMLDLIQACVLRVLGLKFLRIDGTIDAKDRDLKLSKFQAEDSRYFCMCLSTHVGGVGLTITGADRVILTDPAWNPAMDSQAIDRVHRIGQRKDVVVYRLIGSGAIEDKMFRLQVFKRSLAKTAMEQESQIRFFSTKDLKQLFEAPSESTSTQSLMAEQLGTEALEHEDLLNVVAADIGSTDDQDANAFWQSSDVLGFSDYSRLFMYLEQVQKSEEEAGGKAKEMIEKLRNEEYKTDQVVEGKWRANTWKDQVPTPQTQASSSQDAAPLMDA